MIANALKYSKKLVYSYFILVLNRVSFWVKCLRKGLKILNCLKRDREIGELCLKQGQGLNHRATPPYPSICWVTLPPPPRGSRVTHHASRVRLYPCTFFNVSLFIFLNEIQGKAFVIHLSFEDRNCFYIDCFSLVFNVRHLYLYLGPRGHRLI